MARIVLVGLGHAHLHVAARADEFRRAGYELVLVDPGTFWYSSIASGLLGGRYERSDDTIEAAPFARGVGIEHVAARATGIDREAREVLVGSDEVVGSDDAENEAARTQARRVPYDLVSFNVGSVVRPPFPVDEAAAASTAKPIAKFLDLRHTLVGAFRAGRSVRLVTVGGNYSGCELTCNLAALARNHGADLEATLLCDGDALLAGEPAGARRAMAGVLAGYGVDVRLGERASAVRANGERNRHDPNGHDRGGRGRVETESGQNYPFDHVIVATGLTAAPLMDELGLPADPDRGLAVTPALHSPHDHRVFAAGDCADIAGRDLPKVGVFGVRAAPVLADNLLAAAAGAPLRRYRPQRVWFASQNLGDGTGLATWGPLWWRGRAALAIKDRIDRRFMERYRALCAS